MRKGSEGGRGGRKKKEVEGREEGREAEMGRGKGEGGRGVEGRRRREGRGGGGEKVGQKRNARRQEGSRGTCSYGLPKSHDKKNFQTGELVCQCKHAYCMDGSSK